MGGSEMRISHSTMLECEGDLFFFQAEDGIRDSVGSRGLGDVYERQAWACAVRVTSVVLRYKMQSTSPDVQLCDSLALLSKCGNIENMTPIRPRLPSLPRESSEDWKILVKLSKLVAWKKPGTSLIEETSHSKLTSSMLSITSTVGGTNSDNAFAAVLVLTAPDRQPARARGGTSIFQKRLNEVKELEALLVITPLGVV